MAISLFVVHDVKLRSYKKKWRSIPLASLQCLLAMAEKEKMACDFRLFYDSSKY